MTSMNTMIVAENLKPNLKLVLPITDYSSLQEANDISCVSFFSLV